MKSDLNFTKDANGNSKYASFRDGSNIIALIPELVESDMKFGNYKDLIQGRLKQYNSDANDRNLLVGNGFGLPGNPIFSFNGEQTLIYDLENPDLAFVKELVSGLNPNTNLNGSWSLPVDEEIYNRIKESKGTHTLSKKLVEELKNNAHSNVAKREELIEKFCQDDSKLAKEYMDFVKDYKNTNMEEVLGFFPGNFEGMRLVCLGSVGYDCAAGSDYGLKSSYNSLFGCRR
ncbi:MAG: hypothetical protein PHU51_02285 [Candidatus Nanoarchaeia archaeon]|nr:hypothetical protein [Candidatus Nanoarchaeia archaeon]